MAIHPDSVCCVVHSAIRFPLGQIVVRKDRTWLCVSSHPRQLCDGCVCVCVCVCVRERVCAWKFMCEAPSSHQNAFLSKFHMQNYPREGWVMVTPIYFIHTHTHKHIYIDIKWSPAVRYRDIYSHWWIGYMWVTYRKSQKAEMHLAANCTCSPCETTSALSSECTIGNDIPVFTLGGNELVICRKVKPPSPGTSCITAVIIM